MFINLSNHKSATWQKSQVKSAEKYGKIMDINFPEINGSTSENEVQKFVYEYYNMLNELTFDAIFLAGEYTFVYSMIKLLLKDNKNVFSIKTEFELSHYIDSDGIKKRKIKSNFIDFIKYTTYEKNVEKIKHHNNILLNCSMNYPSSIWDDNMREKAQVYEKIMDLKIDVLDMENQEIRNKAIEKYLTMIDEINPKSIVLDGQFFTFYILADVLIRKGYEILVKCSDRVSKESTDSNGNLIKESVYKFKQFRKLQNI